MAAIIPVVAGLVFAYIGGGIMTYSADKILERLSMIEDEIDNHKHSIFLLEDEQEALLDEPREIQERGRIAEDRAWRQMKL